MSGGGEHGAAGELGLNDRRASQLTEIQSLLDGLRTKDRETAEMPDHIFLCAQAVGLHGVQRLR